LSDKKDLKLLKEKKEQIICRDILKEVLDFGVSEHQKKFLIKLLSSELEDFEMSKKITSIINNTSKENKTKLIK